MKPNDKVTFFRNTKEVIKSEMLTNEKNIAWKDGKIQFKNKPFKEIAKDLYIQFHVKITLRMSNSNSKLQFVQ